MTRGGPGGARGRPWSHFGAQGCPRDEQYAKSEGYDPPPPQGATLGAHFGTFSQQSHHSMQKNMNKLGVRTRLEKGPRPEGAKV